MKKLRIFAIICVLGLTALFLRGKLPHERFDSHRWKTANLNQEENMTLRWDMMNDLRSRHKLIGMSKKQIVDLLGNPGDTSVSEFNYYLGYSKRGINTGSLTITFNDKGVVKNVLVWQG